MMSSREDPLEQVLTAAEAADKLGVTRRQISRLCSQGKLKYREAPGSLLLLKASVEEYAESRIKNNEGGD